MMNRKLFLLLMPFILLIGCQTAVAPEATAPPPTGIAAPEMAATPPEPTAVVETPTGEPPAPTPTPSPTATPEPEASYRVIFVEADDTLNVRAAPGADNPVVAELAPDATDIRITGPGEQVDDWLWLPVEVGSATGWVNGRYLTEMVSEADFCDNPDVLNLLDDFRAAVAAQDGPALAELIHPEHGLTIHRYWWNPAVWFTATDTADLFTSAADHYWGQADGTGFDMNGSFMEYIYPRMERNLLPATELGCNEILHGATAGHVWLPEGYENVNFYAIHRPYAEDQFELDWGTWVVGIERWQGGYYISYLVHYEWEI
jgi:hypothetical protein